MSSSVPNPMLRRRIELALRIASPFLDLGLAVGDRVSRVLAPSDPVPLATSARLPRAARHGEVEEARRQAAQTPHGPASG